MFISLEMFKKTHEDISHDARYKAQGEEIYKAFSTIDKQWLSGKIILNDLLWVLADGKQKDRSSYISLIIQSAITSKALTIWDENEYVKLNDRAIHTKELPYKALVLKRDFLHWLQQEKSIQLPQRLINLDLCEIKECVTNNVASEHNIQKSKEQNKTKRTNPVRDAMLNIRVNHPEISKLEMWAKIKEMARESNAPFVFMDDSHSVFYETGGNAKNDHKELKLTDFNKRFDRLTPLVTANNR